jgi:hypothetical protein
MWKWFGVRQRIAARRRWERVNGSVDAFSTRLHIETWRRTERIVVFRKRVSGKSRKNLQLDLFGPDDGHYEYSMVATDDRRASGLGVHSVELDGGACERDFLARW